jgi:hypothetical protein
METKMKKYSLLVVVAMVFNLSAATGYTQPRSTSATPTTQTKEFVISGALSGGVAYSVTIAIGELLNKYVTTPYKLRVVVQPITAMVESPKRLARGEVEIAWIQPAQLPQRWAPVFSRTWVKCQCGCSSGVIRILIIFTRRTKNTVRIGLKRQENSG